MKQLPIPTLQVNSIPPDLEPGGQATLEQLAQSIYAAINTYPHFVVVSGYPPIQDRTNLVNLSQAIYAVSSGQPLSDSISQNRVRVSFTQVRINQAKAVNTGRVTQYSRTHLPLPPHTDSSYRTNPHDLVAFQCLVADRIGGESLMMPVEDILSQVEPQTLELLRDSVFPFGNNLYPIISGATGKEQIRYYRGQIDQTLTRENAILPDKYLAAIDSLDALLQQSNKVIQFALQPGQIVLMHNHKVLHGRTGFTPESDRLLYRVRLHLGNFQNSTNNLPNSEKMNYPPQLNKVTQLNIQGHILLSKGHFAEAAQAFLDCLKISPNHYESGLALSSLADARRDYQAARKILNQVAKTHPLIWEGQPQPNKPTLLRIRGIEGSAYRIVQQSDGTYKSVLRGGHFSVRDLIEQEKYNLMILNLLEDNIEEFKSIPQFNLLLNTIACPDLKRVSLLAAARFIDRYPHIPVINDPRRVLMTTRDRNYLRLNLIPGVIFPKTEKLRWDGLSLTAIAKEISGLGFSFPLIIRLVGSQTGTSVKLVNNQSELESHFQNSSPNQEYYVIQFQDYRNSKKVYNKTRVFFIDGNLYPVAHLFNDAWNVHSGDRYNLMAHTPWTQEEEKSFLNDPMTYFGTANLNKLYQIRDLIGLDFFGIDLTVLPDGTIFIFELNAAMRHNFDHASNFPYTEPHLRRVSKAFDTMIQNRLQQ